MAILKNIIIWAAMAVTMSSCYTAFEPDEDATKLVLCMNSVVTADEPIAVYLTHTWVYSKVGANQFYTDFLRELTVSDATIKLYINDEFVENLTYQGEDYLYYLSTASAKVGDRVKLVAESKVYGSAEAEIVMPLAVPIDKVEYTINPTYNYVGQSFDEKDESRYVLTFDLDMNVYFTDPDNQTNYYLYSGGYNDGDYDNVEFYASNVDYEAEPLFSEHVSALEKITGSDGYGCTFFTDAQISGKTYPLRIKYNMRYGNRGNSDEQQYYDVSINPTIYTITESYYKWLVYRWQDTDGLKGTLRDSGFGDSLLGYSNVSTGAGVVVGRTPSVYKISLADTLKQLHDEALAEE